MDQQPALPHRREAMTDGMLASFPCVSSLMAMCTSWPGIYTEIAVVD